MGNTAIKNGAQIASWPPEDGMEYVDLTSSLLLMLLLSSCFFFCICLSLDNHTLNILCYSFLATKY